MTPDRDLTPIEDRLGRTLTVLARTIPDEPPPFRLDPVIVLDHRRGPRHSVAIAVTATALAVAAAAAGLVVATSGGSGPTIKLGGDRPAPAAPAPADGLVAVPDVVGLPLDQAEANLTAAGFVVYVVSGGSRESQTATVLTETPTGRVQPGATIALTVAPG